MRVTLTATAGNDPFSAQAKPLPHGELGGVGAGPGVAKCLRIAVSTDAALGAADTLWLALRDDKNCYKIIPVAIDAISGARAQAGGAGNYVCSVDINASGKDIHDLMGSGGKKGDDPNGPLRWYVLCPGTFPSGVSNLHVDTWVSNDI